MLKFGLKGVKQIGSKDTHQMLIKFKDATASISRFFCMHVRTYMQCVPQVLLWPVYDVFQMLL